LKLKMIAIAKINFFIAKNFNYYFFKYIKITLNIALLKQNIMIFF